MNVLQVVIILLILLLLLVITFSTFKIVRPYQRGVVERLGRYKATNDPGLCIILPFVDRMVLVDLREQVVDVPPQEVITADNVVVTVYAVVFHEATDAQRLIYNVANFAYAVSKLAQTNLRNVIGDMQLDEALKSSHVINTHLRDILGDATDKWGVRVVRVEIQRIDPPPDVVQAMHHQMQSERTRRAVVTEAAGVREAAITRAEGEKQAAILEAEGEKQKRALEAQGEATAIERIADAERYRQLAVAEGEAGATRAVFGAIHEGGPTPDLIAIKYLEALARVANGRATKIFLPAEMQGLFGTVGGLAALFEGQRDDEPEAPAVTTKTTEPAPEASS
jgi:regulator of protease activity HflC (stomatin/prohibitin superfamily)